MPSPIFQSALLSDDNPDASELPIYKTSAIRGDGFVSLVDRLEKDAGCSQSQCARRHKLAMTELMDLMDERILEYFKAKWLTDEKWSEISDAMKTHPNDPYSPVDEFLAGVLSRIPRPD